MTSRKNLILYKMTTTIFETIATLLVKTRSANTILYYIENKGWFEKYKTGQAQPGKYLSIPYKEWTMKTLINQQHIKILAALIFDNNGDIQYNDQTNTVDIWGSNVDIFKSIPAKDHIIHICKKKQRILPLIKYLEEFYGYDLRNYRYEAYNIVYRIDYDHWLELFQMDAVEIALTNQYLTSGQFNVQYDKQGIPEFVVIRIK